MRCPEVYIQSMVCFFRYQVANSIDIMNSRDNPLVCVTATIDYRPQIVLIEATHEFKILPKYLKSNSTPNVMS